MLEEKIDALIAAVKANTAALTGKGGGAAGGTAGTGKAGTTGGSKITFEQVKAAVVKVKDAKGKPAAQKIIREAGKAAELASIKAPQYEAVIEACKEALEEGEDAGGGEDEDTL